MIESVLTPDHELRTEAAYAGCLDELLEIRQEMVDHLNSERAIINKMTEPQVQAFLGSGAPGATSDRDY